MSFSTRKQREFSKNNVENFDRFSEKNTVLLIPLLLMVE